MIEQKTEEVIKFSVYHTKVCKGVAILLMVWHHLFYKDEYINMSLTTDFGVSIPYRIATFGKICVTIFTILSGYGIMTIYKSKNTNWLEFQKERTLRLWVNYLLVVVLTVMTFAFFPEVWNSNIGKGIAAIYRLCLSFTGFQYVLLNMGINIVWWYITMLLVCYITFPFLKKVLQNHPKISFVVSLVIIVLGNVYLPRVGFFAIVSWGAVFYIGCLLADDNRLSEFLSKYSERCWIKIAVAILLVTFVVFRCYDASYQLYTRYIDIVGTICLMLLVGWSKKMIVTNVLAWFGEISMDIYFVHLLFNEYLIHDFVYSLHNPIFMYAVVLILSVFSHYVLFVIRKFVNVIFKIVGKRIRGCRNVPEK